MNTTLDYYNQNAISFVQGTKDVDFTTIQENFTKKRGGLRRRNRKLFLTERHTVRALIYCGIALVCSHQDSIQRAEIGIIAMMCALGNSTFNAFICVTIHSCVLLSMLICLVLPFFKKPYIKQYRLTFSYKTTII